MYEHGLHLDTVNIHVIILHCIQKRKVEETADFATLTRKNKLVAKGEKEHLIYGCDVPAGKECAKRIEVNYSNFTQNINYSCFN